MTPDNVARHNSWHIKKYDPLCELCCNTGIPREGLSKAEPSPVKNESTPIWELVIKDMQDRDNAGRAKYGTPLQANNGRDALVDAYQEALDLVVYLRQAIDERRQYDSVRKLGKHI